MFICTQPTQKSTICRSCSVRSLPHSYTASAREPALAVIASALRSARRPHINKCADHRSAPQGLIGTESTDRRHWKTYAARPAAAARRRRRPLFTPLSVPGAFGARFTWQRRKMDETESHTRGELGDRGKLGDALNEAGVPRCGTVYCKNLDLLNVGYQPCFNTERIMLYFSGYCNL